MRQQVPVCTDASFKQGEEFDWVNHGKTAVTIKKCKPPLEKTSYSVPAGGSTPAKVSDDAEKKKHQYECEPDKGPKTNPHIIIIT